MENQVILKTLCDDCRCELIVPTITDFGVTVQTAPVICICGWTQPGKQLRNGFIANNPKGYYNLRNE